MTPKDPDLIRAEIDQTRAELATDANRLTEKVTPAKVVERRVDGVKDAVAGLKDRVVGSAGHAGAATSGTAGTAVNSLSGAASSAATAVAGAPQVAKKQTAGSPLIAGAVAFGAGYLLSALLPATRREQEMAGQLTDQASSLTEPVKDTLVSAEAEIREQVAPQVTDAVQAVKEAGTAAVGAVSDAASSAAGDVKSTAASAAGTTADQANASVAAVKNTAYEAPAQSAPLGEPYPVPVVPGPAVGGVGVSGHVSEAADSGSYPERIGLPPL